MNKKSLFEKSSVSVAFEKRNVLAERFIAENSFQSTTSQRQFIVKLKENTEMLDIWIDHNLWFIAFQFPHANWCECEGEKISFDRLVWENFHSVVILMLI